MESALRNPASLEFENWNLKFGLYTGHSLKCNGLCWRALRFSSLNVSVYELANWSAVQRGTRSWYKMKKKNECCHSLCSRSPSPSLSLSLLLQIIWSCSQKEQKFFFKLNYNKRKLTLTRSEFICKIRDHQEVGNNCARVVAEQGDHISVSVEAGDFPVYPFEGEDHIVDAEIAGQVLNQER